MIGMMFAVPFIFFFLAATWVRTVIFRGPETIQVIKNIISDPSYIEVYKHHKQLWEQFNGSGSWEHTINNTINLMRKHLRYNTIVLHFLLL